VIICCFSEEIKNPLNPGPNHELAKLIFGCLIYLNFAKCSS
jgi:hypothetical protein